MSKKTCKLVSPSWTRSGKMDRRFLKLETCLLALLSLALLSAPLLAQTAATLSGRVMDASQAVLTNAEVTAVNIDTGVETRATTNNAGVYGFPSLQAGTYRVLAQAAGFQTKTMTDVRLRAGTPSSLNFELTVAGITTDIEVTGTAENMILDAGSSTGIVLQEQLVSELPLVSNDVMDLINIMGGVVKSENPIFDNVNQTFAGVASGNINVSRDGLSVSEVRYSSGIVAPSRVNQDMIGEFKMILSPVDAEMGRGAGQVQITTRSGSNNFRGSGVWNIQNTALDAREWEMKRRGDEPAWRNLHNYSLSVGGPIIKNRTFFFVSWDQQIVREKSPVRPPTLTNCARLGIYRYFAGWRSLNALNHIGFIDQGNPFATPARPVVDQEGNPLLSYTHPDSGVNVTQTMADLRYENVMGDLPLAARQALDQDPINCAAYEDWASRNGGVYSNSIITTPWSRAGVRDQFDQSGYVEKFTRMVPRANVFDVSDGLNIAAYRWTRTTKGANTLFGVGQDAERKTINLKIDHNINNEHRLSGTYNYEKLIGEDSMPTWDNEYSYGGSIARMPQSFSLSLTSTLNPTLLNEFRFGLTRVVADMHNPLDANPDTLGKLLNDLLPVSNQYPVVVGYDAIGYSPGYAWNIFGPGMSHPFGSMSVLGSSQGGFDHRWTASDTITWIKGVHSFKGGFEIRLSRSQQESDGEGAFRAGSILPAVQGGRMAASGYMNNEFGWAGMAGMEDGSAQSDYGNVRNMLDWFSGSVQEIQQFFYAASKDGGGRWNDLLAGENWQVFDLRNRELAFFFKDDWKVTNDLTLNLGVRYEYYGVPWEETGMTLALKDGSNSLWGPCGGSFDSWMPAIPSGACGGSPAVYQFVGPNSPNPNIGAWNKDKNNFAPHVGFSWQLPWFGRGLTTLRGGYSISYSPIARFDSYAGVMSRVPGTQFRRTEGSAEWNYLTLNDLLDSSKGVLPLRQPDDPSLGENRIFVLGERPLTERSQTFTVYDDDIRNPYVQNVNLSVTRQIGNIFTVDVRYIGTLSRKQIRNVNLNTPNYINNGLLAEFEKVRRGESSAVIDALIPVGTLAFSGATGSEQLVASASATRTNMINGNFYGVANTLATTNGMMFGIPSGTAGNVLRSGQWNGSAVPENLIYASPQLANATLTSNDGYTNYHSMQAQVTMRPWRGLNFQSTYTWSRNLTDQNILNYITGERAYYLADQHRSHVLNSYGSYELPFGANGFFLRDAQGAFKKAVEGWQLSWILALSSGLPGSLTGGNTLWNATRPVLERPDLWDNKAGKVAWEKDAYSGYFFGDRYIRVADPICSDRNFVSEALSGTCGQNLKALALSGDPGTIVVRNARPDEVGNMSPNSLTGPGRWNFDMAMSKSIEFMEGRRIEVRVDAENIFNHPMPSNSAFSWNARFTQISNPDFALNAAAADGFGQLSTKGGHRTFQAKIRIVF